MRCGLTGFEKTCSGGARLLEIHDETTKNIVDILTRVASAFLKILRFLRKFLTAKRESPRRKED